MVGCAGSPAGAALRFGLPSFHFLPPVPFRAVPSFRSTGRCVEPIGTTALFTLRIRCNGPLCRMDSPQRAVVPNGFTPTCRCAEWDSPQRAVVPNGDHERAEEVAQEALLPA